MKYIVLLAVLCADCSSVKYGSLDVQSFGTELVVGNAQWERSTDSNGAVTEKLTVQDANKNSTETVHSTANVCMALIGALIGLPAGVPGMAIGSAAGVSVTELYQTAKDWLNKDKQ